MHASKPLPTASSTWRTGASCRMRPRARPRRPWRPCEDNMKRPSSALVIALALAAAAALGGCQRQGAGKAAAAQTAPTPYAAIAEGKADIEGGIINVAARSPGVVRAVYVQEGETVKKGQILTRQEDDAQRLAVQTAEAALAQAKAQMQLTEVQLATAQREFDRLQPLASSQFV